jgi:DNA polymerase III alpha subunit (gram-positive type)
MSEYVYAVSADLETTDLSTQNGRFVQLGSCVYLIHIPTGEFKHLDNFELCCRSEVKMHPKSVEITGMTQEFIDSQPLSAKDVLNRFVSFLDKVCINQIPRVLFTYNGHGFDIPFLVFESHRSKLGAETYFRSLKLTSSLDVLIAGRDLFDTTYLHRNANGQCSYKLGSVYNSLLKKPLLNAHGGLADSTAVVEVIQATYKSFQPYISAATIGDYGNLNGIQNTMTLVRSLMTQMPKEDKGKVNVRERLIFLMEQQTKRQKMHQ